MEINISDNHGRILARRIELGHPTTFSKEKRRKTQINVYRPLIVSASGGVMYR